MSASELVLYGNPGAASVQGANSIHGSIYGAPQGKLADSLKEEATVRL